MWLSVITVTPVVTGTLVHLLSRHEVIVITVVLCLVTVSANPAVVTSGESEVDDPVMVDSELFSLALGTEEVAVLPELVSDDDDTSGVEFEDVASLLGVVFDVLVS